MLHSKHRIIVTLIVWKWIFNFRHVWKYLRLVTFSFVMSVGRSARPSAWNNSASSGRIFMKFDIWVFSEKSVKKITVLLQFNHLRIYILEIYRRMFIRIGSFSERKLAVNINPLNPELNPICYLLALLGAHHFLHVSRIRVKILTFRLLIL